MYKDYIIKINTTNYILIINYLMVLVAVLFSKTMFFGVHISSSFQYVFYLTCIIGFFVTNGSITTLFNNFIRVGLLWIPLLIQILLNYNSFVSDGLNNILGLMLKILCCAFFASSMTNQRFRRCYVDIIYFVCLLSLPFFVISLVFPTLAHSLAMTSFQWQNPYEYSWFYTWGRAGTIITKNAGPFWEQGAFQGFINLAILFLMDSMKTHNLDTIKNREIKLVVFLITILTTQSTTGYILCIIILSLFYKDFKTTLVLGKNYRVLREIFIFLGVIAMSLFIVLSGNIADKLTNAETQSAAIRANDFFYSLLFIPIGGLWGLGPTIKTFLLEHSTGLGNNSVGLLSMTYYYGLVFASLYVYYQYQYLRTFHSTVIKIPVYVLIFLILHCTEGYWFLVIFLAMLMKYKKA